MAPEAETPTPTAVASVIAPVVRASGLFLEDVTIVGPAHRAVVRVTVDLEENEVGSVELERVAEVSRAVSDALDASDLFPRAYQLEVSSPGTSRPLTEPRHFRRARTRLVRIELQATCWGYASLSHDTSVDIDERKFEEFEPFLRALIEDGIHGSKDSNAYWGIRGLYSGTLGNCNTWTAASADVD